MDGENHLRELIINKLNFGKQNILTPTNSFFSECTTVQLGKTEAGITHELKGHCFKFI